MVARDEWSAVMSAIASRRDRAAFAQVFDHFAPRLEAYLQRLGIDAAAAEEITQDVMLTVWRKADLFDATKSSLATWLYRIARNRRIDRSRRDRVDYLDPQSDTFEQVADDVSPDSIVDLQQREEVLRTALQSLPDEQLTLVKLAFFESLSHSVIAERTKLPLGTVKSRIRLAFARLRRALESEGVLEAS